jgi:2'-5' RNA ligase
VDQFALASAAQELASRAPVTAVISGHARFTGGSDGDVIVALADSPALDVLRRDAENALAVRGITLPSEHGFTPHLTICYLEPGDPDPVGRLDAFPVTFPAVAAEYGTGRYAFPFAGEPASAPVPGTAAWLALTEATR